MGTAKTLRALMAAHSRRQLQPAPAGCLTPGCKRKADRRGLCGTHYCEARQRVNAGETDWIALILAGQALPAKNWAARPFKIRGK